MNLQPLNARLFIALPIPPIYRPILTDWTNILKEKWSFKRWLHQDDYHITIKFIGNCDFTKALLIKERLQNLSTTLTPFSFSPYQSTD